MKGQNVKDKQCDWSTELLGITGKTDVWKFLASPLSLVDWLTSS